MLWICNPPKKDRHRRLNIFIEDIYLNIDLLGFLQIKNNGYFKDKVTKFVICLYYLPFTMVCCLSCVLDRESKMHQNVVVALAEISGQSHGLQETPRMITVRSSLN
jgi:hypothetical protein